MRCLTRISLPLVAFPRPYLPHVKILPHRHYSTANTNNKKFSKRKKALKEEPPAWSYRPPSEELDDHIEAEALARGRVLTEDEKEDVRWEVSNVTKSGRNERVWDRLLGAKKVKTGEDELEKVDMDVEVEEGSRNIRCVGALRRRGVVRPVQFGEVKAGIMDERPVEDSRLKIRIIRAKPRKGLIVLPPDRFGEVEGGDVEAPEENLIEKRRDEVPLKEREEPRSVHFKGVRKVKMLKSDGERRFVFGKSRTATAELASKELEDAEELDLRQRLETQVRKHPGELIHPIFKVRRVLATAAKEPEISQPFWKHVALQLFRDEYTKKDSTPIIRLTLAPPEKKPTPEQVAKANQGRDVEERIARIALDSRLTKKDNLRALHFAKAGIMEPGNSKPADQERAKNVALRIRKSLVLGVRRPKSLRIRKHTTICIRRRHSLLRKYTVLWVRRGAWAHRIPRYMTLRLYIALRKEGILKPRFIQLRRKSWVWKRAAFRQRRIIQSKLVQFKLNSRFKQRHTKAYTAVRKVPTKIKRKDSNQVTGSQKTVSDPLAAFNAMWAGLDSNATQAHKTAASDANLDADALPVRTHSDQAAFDDNWSDVYPKIQPAQKFSRGDGFHAELPELYKVNLKALSSERLQVAVPTRKPSGRKIFDAMLADVESGIPGAKKSPWEGPFKLEISKFYEGVRIQKYASVRGVSIRKQSSMGKGKVKEEVDPESPRERARKTMIEKKFGLMKDVEEQDRRWRCCLN